MNGPAERQEWEDEFDADGLDYKYGVTSDDGVTIEQLAMVAGIDYSDLTRDKGYDS